MKEVNLSTLLAACGHDIRDFRTNELRVVIDCNAHFSFPNDNNQDYPGFGVHFPSFGDSETDDAYSEPVWIEYRNADGLRYPTVNAWPDINMNECIKVSLEGAHIDCRGEPFGGH